MRGIVFHETRVVVQMQKPRFDNGEAALNVGAIWPGPLNVQT